MKTTNPIHVIKNKHVFSKEAELAPEAATPISFFSQFFFVNFQFSVATKTSL